MIYLDNSATTRLAPEVIDAMNSYRALHFANASSVHRDGQHARMVIDEVHSVIASALRIEPKEVVLTSGGTEANNYALKGFAWHVQSHNGYLPRIISSRTEHPSVLKTLEYLNWMGSDVLLLDVDNDGRVRPSDLEEALATHPSDQQSLVSIMYANNETGTINPIRELSDVAHQHGASFHCDAVQTFGKIRFSMADLGADMLSISSHKIHGPKGIGALCVAQHVQLEPLMHGGSQERNRRGGTESPELAVGFSEAVRLSQSDLEGLWEHFSELDETLRNGLRAIDNVHIVTPECIVMKNILDITFDDAEQMDGEGLIVGMDLEGIAVSNGSACASGSMQPSHVLTAMGLTPEQARTAIRFSSSRYTTKEEILKAMNALSKVVARLRTPSISVTA